MPGCRGSLATGRAYNARYRLCDEHLRAESVLLGGAVQRFCQARPAPAAGTASRQPPASRRPARAHARRGADASALTRRGDRAEVQPLPRVGRF